MKPLHSEIEIRVQLDTAHGDSLRALLNSTPGAREEIQDDTYYDTQGRDWTSADPVKKWLRLRRLSEAAQLNLKAFTFSAEGVTTGNTEIEFEVASASQAEALLLGLGYSPVIRVSKKRISATVEDVHVALDEVTDLGLFAELEAIRPHGDYAQTISYLWSFAQVLDLGDCALNERGYPYELLKIERRRTQTHP